MIKVSLCTQVMVQHQGHQELGLKVATKYSADLRPS